jgi:hypothetical protein
METKEPYLLEDLVNDKSFRDFIWKSNTINTEKWRKWIEENPHQSALLNEAEKVIAAQTVQKGMTIL